MRHRQRVEREEHEMKEQAALQAVRAAIFPTLRRAIPTPSDPRRRYAAGERC
jgi:hypothetical protein